MSKYMAQQVGVLPGAASSPIIGQVVPTTGYPVPTAILLERRKHLWESSLPSYPGIRSDECSGIALLCGCSSYITTCSIYGAIFHIYI